MCNFMGTTVSRVQFIKLMKIEKELGILAAMNELEELKNGFSYSNSLVLRKYGADDVEAVSMHWEFIPSWIKTMEEVKAARKQGIPWLNVTNEKLLDSKMFRHAALNRRCLVLATHFFEWRHYQPQAAKKPIAFPYLIQRADVPYFYMAGIWQPWTDKETGETIDTFAIITTKASSFMASIHNTKKRMPTILPEDVAYRWIMDDLKEEEIKEIACYQLASEKLTAYTIAKDFKTATDPLAAFTYADLPALETI